jgi:hypothetical protein
MTQISVPKHRENLKKNASSQLKNNNMIPKLSKPAGSAKFQTLKPKKFTKQLKLQISKPVKCGDLYTG